jgi:erythromycin esterase-like protein
MSDPVRQLTAAAEPLPDLEDPEFAAFVDRFASARVVLLGEASHGTAEFYEARAAISRRLIERHGFTIVAVEADWPDAAAVNRFVQSRPATAEQPFTRFPTWMWRNAEFEGFLRWLRGWNAEAETPTGFYGLDLYNLSGSIRAVLDYLDRSDPEAAALARRHYGCLRPWMEEPQRYGLYVRSTGRAVCEAGVVEMLSELHRRQLDCSGDCEGLLDATGNARLVANAEAYYRAMFEGSDASWNLRDSHMSETLDALLEAHPDGKAIVWAHNSHIGDARATEMGAQRGELNLGQLARESFGSGAVLIGFGTDRGEVACADDWDAPMETKAVRPARADSIEWLARETGLPRFLIDLRNLADPALYRTLAEPRLERFIGVIYRPQTERWSHYAEARLADQFDAYLWFEETRAVTSLAGPERAGEEEMWPFGM